MLQKDSGPHSSTCLLTEDASISGPLAEDSIHIQAIDDCRQHVKVLVLKEEKMSYNPPCTWEELHGGRHM